MYMLFVVAKPTILCHAGIAAVNPELFSATNSKSRAQTIAHTMVPPRVLSIHQSNTPIPRLNSDYASHTVCTSTQDIKRKREKASDLFIVSPGGFFLPQHLAPMHAKLSITIPIPIHIPSFVHFSSLHLVYGPEHTTQIYDRLSKLI